MSGLFSGCNGGHWPLISLRYESYHIIQAFLSSLYSSSDGQPGTETHLMLTVKASRTENSHNLLVKHDVIMNYSFHNTVNNECCI